ncbi:hypothetical protein SPWS13_1335 [Shewanella putrefaciens]|nr:hypothetical protein SPWS13_1335 [Shewanella putrefaciens]
MAIFLFWFWVIKNKAGSQNHILLVGKDDESTLYNNSV